MIYMERAGIPGGGNWGTEENSPEDVVLLHEGLHAARRIRRLAIDGTINAQGHDVPIEEPYVGGYGPGAFATIGTENAYRRESRLPLRTHYGSNSELGLGGDWAGISARNEDEWWRLYNEQQARRGRPPTHPPRDIPTQVAQSQGAGYKLITNQEEYNGLLKGDPDLRTYFSSDNEFSGIIRFHQETAQGEVINKGVIDKEATPEVAGHAMYERDFMDQVRRGDFDFTPLFKLRFQERSGRPEWSPAATRMVDDWLTNAKPSYEEQDELFIEILGKHYWSPGELRAIRDSGVVKNHGRLDQAITAFFYDQAHVPQKQEYEDALNALAVYIATPMQRDRRLPELNDEAKGYLMTVVKYHLKNFKAKGDDRQYSWLAQRYHLGDDYLFKDVPGLIGERVENVFGPGFEGDAASDVVWQWFSDKDSDAYGAMKEAILQEYHDYVAWSGWVFGGPDDPRLAPPE
jgi:hypothetical protein